MRESSKRQVTHPWLMASDRVTTDLPPGAEAPTTVRSAVPEPSLSSLFRSPRPEVVIKRKRAFKTPAPDTLAEDADSSVGEAERAPKVFRVAQGVVAQEAPTEPPLAVNPDDAVSPAPVIPVPTTGYRRRRRRASPAVVVFSKSAEEGAEERQPDSVDTQGADKALAMLRQLDAVVDEIRRAQSFHVSQPASDSGMLPPAGGTQYQSLLAQIRELQQEADRARSAEKSRAIAWIKKAIAEHKLTADDLGF